MHPSSLISSTRGCYNALYCDLISSKYFRRILKFPRLHFYHVYSLFKKIYSCISYKKKCIQLFLPFQLPSSLILMKFLIHYNISKNKSCIPFFQAFNLILKDWNISLLKIAFFIFERIWKDMKKVFEAKNLWFLIYFIIIVL